MSNGVGGEGVGGEGAGATAEVGAVVGAGAVRPSAPRWALASSALRQRLPVRHTTTGMVTPPTGMATPPTGMATPPMGMATRTKFAGALRESQFTLVVTSPWLFWRA